MATYHTLNVVANYEMKKNRNLISLKIAGNKYSISDRLMINWKEIILFPASIFLILMIFGGPIVAIIVSIFVTIYLSYLDFPPGTIILRLVLIL